MHNSFFYVLILVCLLSIYSQSAVSIKIDQTISLINENMVQSCISHSSLLEFYEKGIEYLELDKDILQYKVINTLEKNLSFIEKKVGFYYYDSTTLNKESCAINNNKCNSVQIKIELFYKKEKALRELRYELVKEK